MVVTLPTEKETVGIGVSMYIALRCWSEYIAAGMYCTGETRPRHGAHFATAKRFDAAPPVCRRVDATVPPIGQVQEFC